MPSPCSTCDDSCKDSQSCGTDCKCGPNCKCSEKTESCPCPSGADHETCDKK
ncbi:hypothetical protein D910_10158 [Dendroctonus ponderosae]